MLSVTERLAAWSGGVTLADVPPPVRHAASRHLLDGIGVAVAAARTGAAGPALAVARGLGGPPEAVLLGDTRRVGAVAAAFGTGVLVHALDFDDTHAEGLVHATAAVLPTALAVGQQVGASGADVLVAAVVGYEVVCRLAAGSPHGFHARGLHATAVCAPLAAAAVAAKLLRLDEPATVDALGIAGSSSGGLLEFLATGASTKQLHPGSAALSGILAARLAAAGSSGPRSVVEGTQGVYAALSAGPVDPDRVVRGLADGLGAPGTWETQALTIKPYPCCQLMHGALDAGLQLLADGVRPVDVAELLVQLHPDSLAVVGTDAPGKTEPRTAYEAKFALPWTLGALLLDGRVALDTYAAPSLVRPAVLDLARRVRCVAVPGCGAAADAETHLVALLTDGTRREVAVQGSRGGPRDPLSDAGLVEKFLANTGGGSAAKELADRFLDLAAEESLARAVALAAALVQERRS